MPIIFNAILSIEAQIPSRLPPWRYSWPIDSRLYLERTAAESFRGSIAGLSFAYVTRCAIIRANSRLCWSSSKKCDAAHSGPRIGSVTSLRQRVSNHSNKRVDQIKNLKALATTRADETLR